ncbi:MAG TPA: hypothetical protein PKY82_20020 [Pyrinomonadaceae bacterium]|nr:hypothetical protein [Pyrinomonadaceae bacterium]
MKFWIFKMFIFLLSLLIGIFLSQATFYQNEKEFESTRFSSQNAKSYNPEEFNWENKSSNKCSKISEYITERLSLIKEKSEVEQTLVELKHKKNKKVDKLKTRLKSIEEQIEKLASNGLNFKENNPNQNLLFVENCTEY